MRLATHAPYREFVEGFGLEFFPLGGDPKLLSEYVVKNRGIFTNNLYEVKAQRQQLRLIINSTYPACTQPDPAHPDLPFTVCPEKWMQARAGERMRSCWRGG